ncbi:uncharacterized protein LOC118267761 [Spodoptera frugiperda]|uniref:Uncharacterized protein LOC118267761 n=1 Tax=Spodoptera frugiperda TaxID=7108 RepID=A0A9R0D2L1_SPOFR|nr:uncharacterized protein LOC118267761 [Spodoptera frugiperda]
MYITASIRSLTPEELRIRRKALRDAIVCIGWLKVLSIICYLSLYMLVVEHSKGTWSTAIQMMILVIIPVQILNGLLLFWGATEAKLSALEFAVWLCVLIAAYNTVLGVIGCIYFIRIGSMFIHFLMAFIFSLLSLSLFTVLCHDVIVIYTFITLAKSPQTFTQPQEIIISVPDLPPPGPKSITHKP